MRVLLVLCLGFASLPSLVAAQGASELGAPHTPEPATTSETESVDPAVAQSATTQGSTQGSTASPPSTPPDPTTPPNGAPLVPPGYESTPPQPAYGQPAQPGYAQPTYGAPAYAPPLASGPIPRRTRIRLRDGMEVPPYARVYERRLGFLMWPGLGLFVGGYAISTILATDDAIAAVPLVGPLLWQAQHGTSQDLELTIPLTILQVVGVVAFSIGVKKRRYAEVWRVGDQPVPPPGRQFAVAPYADRHGGGISLMVY
ncbi:MAG: hypothetical protein MUE69_29935 [Myxococcota bacterium]|jgi:hypothetical protein|nr:hypothetical protein [Myxococcota bacterium]